MTRQQRRAARKTHCARLGHKYHPGFFTGTRDCPTVADSDGNRRPLNQLVDESAGISAKD